MSPSETNAGYLGDGTITYKPDDYGSGTLTVELPIDTPAPRAHLIAAVSELRSDATPGEIAWSVDQVAHGHLTKATGANVLVWRDAQEIHAFAHVPAAPKYNLPTYIEPPAYSNPRPLTADQEALLPHLTQTVRLVVPSELDAHVNEIAHLAAQEIPTQADILHAYQRTSISEVLRNYDGVEESKPLPPEVQQAMRTTLLSFPQHAAQALHTPVHTTAPTPSTTRSARAASHGYDR
jgi:hypothetical protein